MAPDPERKLRLERNVKLALVLRVCIWASAISTPTITKLAQQNGLSESEWLLVQFLFGVVLLLVDIPTGFFADRFSRKLSLLLGGIVLIGGSLLYAFSTDFFSILTAEIVLGVGYGFCSGADHALLYESLIELERESGYERLVRVMQGIEMTAMSIFALAGGIIGSMNVRWPFLVEAAVFSIFVLTAGSFIESKRILSGSRKTFIESLSDARKFRDDPRRLDLQIAVSAITFGGFQTLLWYYQPIFDLYAVPLYFNGLFFMFMYLTAAIIAQTSGWLERSAGGYPAVLFIPLLMCLAVYLGLSLIPGSLSLGILVMVPVARGWNNTLLTAEVNRSISSDVRATMLSVRGAANRCAQMTLLLLGSCLSLYFGIRHTLLICGVMLVLATLELQRRLPSRRPRY